MYRRFCFWRGKTASGLAGSFTESVVQTAHVWVWGHYQWYLHGFDDFFQQPSLLSDRLHSLRIG